jgi:hypothetical protein
LWVRHLLCFNQISQLWYSFHVCYHFWLKQNCSIIHLVSPGFAEGTLNQAYGKYFLSQCRSSRWWLA